MGYELHPETPAQGIFYSELFKGRDMSEYREQIRKRGEEFGLVFAERTLLSNTRMVLQAAEFARDEGAFEGFHEAVFRAYFSEGRDIGNPEVIAAIAGSCGLDPDRMLSAVESGVNLPRLEAAHREGESLGLTGIPLFLINSRLSARRHRRFSGMLSRWSERRRGVPENQKKQDQAVSIQSSSRIARSAAFIRAVMRSFPRTVRISR